jgi:hypothetical protein
MDDLDKRSDGELARMRPTQPTPQQPLQEHTAARQSQHQYNTSS